MPAPVFNTPIHDVIVSEKTEAKTAGREVQRHPFNWTTTCSLDMLCPADQIADLIIPLCDIEIKHTNELAESMHSNKFAYGHGECMTRDLLNRANLL